MRFRNETARAISIVLHPVSSIAIMMLLSSKGGSRFVPLVAFALIVGVPIVAFSHYQVRRGSWEHVDASRPQERHALFWFAGLSVLALAIWFQWNGAYAAARGTFATVVMGAVAYALLRWTKLSLHMAFLAYACGVLLSLRPMAGVALACTAPLLAWSRLAMKRHTPAEVAGGTLLGAVTALAVVVA
jgi:membrane-associated phospholipid phosphatase